MFMASFLSDSFPVKKEHTAKNKTSYFSSLNQQFCIKRKLCLDASESGPVQVPVKMIEI